MATIMMDSVNISEINVKIDSCKCQYTVHASNTIDGYEMKLSTYAYS